MPYLIKSGAFWLASKAGEKNGLIINCRVNGAKLFQDLLQNVIIDFCKVFDSIDPASRTGTWKLILVPFYSLGSLLWKEKSREGQKIAEAHAEIVPSTCSVGDGYQGLLSYT